MAMMIAREIAAELKVSLPNAYRLLKSMPGAFHVGRGVRIERKEFEQWLRDRQDAGQIEQDHKSAA